jgi:hypothetical protein
MANIFNDDFQDFINCLEKSNVKYILVGGYSVVLHGYPRTTGDLDIWVEKSVSNYNLLKIAFYDFGMPIMDQEIFLSNEVDVFTYGRPPQAIDLMTECKGLFFENAYKNSKIITVDSINVRLIHYNDLITAKKSAGRHKDLNDLEHL